MGKDKKRTMAVLIIGDYWMDNYYSDVYITNHIFGDDWRLLEMNYWLGDYVDSFPNIIDEGNGDEAYSWLNCEEWLKERGL